MELNLLSINRVINTMNPNLIEPQNSVIAVNINREAIESIRKQRKISTKVFERKINLSKSRYYRWLRYESDLPFELIMGIKKILNMSDRELLDIFITSTDEQIQLLVLTIYTSTMRTKKERKIFMNIRESLEKYRKSHDDNINYKVILAYSDLVVNCKENINTEKEIYFFESYFMSIEYFTIFDILLYLALLNIISECSIKENILKKQIMILEKSIEKKCLSNKANEWTAILNGCVFDLARILASINEYDQALNFIEKIMLIKQEADDQVLLQEMFNCFIYVYDYKRNPNNICNEKNIRISFSNLKNYLPKKELDFFNNLITKEIDNFE